MSKKSKKKKRKKSSPSSSEEDEKKSREQEATNYCRGVKRKQDERCQESCAKEQDRSVSSTVYSQSTRQIKKPVYRLEKTQAPEQKPVNKEEHCRTSKRDSAPLHGEKCSSKAKNYVSGKDKSVGESKTVEAGPSKSSHTSKSGRDHRRTEKTYEGRLDKKSSRRSPPKLKKQPMTPSLVSAGQYEQRQDVRKRKRSAEETPRARDDSSTVKTREACSSSVSGDSAQRKTRELVKQMCQWFEETKSNSKRSICADSKTPPASTSKTSSTTSTKQTTAESTPEVSKNVTSHRAAPLSSTRKQINFVLPFVPPKFKIPKKVQPIPVDSKAESKDATSASANLKRDIKPSDSGVSTSTSRQKTVQQSHICSDVTPSLEDKSSPAPCPLQATSDTNTQPWHDEMQVVEELHLARSGKRLELNVLQSYGELTCMDIDAPEERPADTHDRQTPQQGLILILDTNVLLSHLDYVKKIRFHGLGGLGFPLVLIPWVVLQELDSLKKGRGLSGSVAHLAIPAISYIHESLKRREPRLWGQSMQQATESCSGNGLNAENNDDRVLQCCLQYQSLYPECAVILCTNDKNLCSKALLSGVNALSKNDLEAEAERSRRGLHDLQNTQAPTPPRINPQISSPPPLLRRSCAAVQPRSREKACLSAALTGKGCKQLSKGDEEATEWDLSRCVSKLEDCLREVLSDVLEVEMKAAYEDLWLEIVYIKPPWTLQDVLQCFKKHWIAVFGHAVPRRHLQTVLNLIDFFRSGGTVDRSAASAALQQAKELVKAFRKSSSHVPRAISVMDVIFTKLQPQKRHPSGHGEPLDVIMNDDDEEYASAQVSHQEVWAVFEGIWSHVYQMSMEVFKALGFDPHTMQSAQPAGGPPPPQDALACLHKLSSMVSQLLQAFSSVLSSAPGLEEVHSLLSVFHSNKILNEDSRLTAKDLLDCFSQPDYREKLRVGGSQLMELREALDRCVQVTGQRVALTT